MKLLCCGQHEHTKAIWHGIIGVMLLGATAYNIAAYITRPKRDLRLLSNAIIYGAGVGLEAVQVKRHIATIREGPQ